MLKKYNLSSDMKVNPLAKTIVVENIPTLIICNEKDLYHNILNFIRKNKIKNYEINIDCR